MKKEIYLFRKGYRIDSDGRILNPKGKVLTGTKDTAGYIYIRFTYAGQALNCGAHRLQAFQKYGEALYDEGIEVRHKDGDKEDNSWRNILIGTHSQNMMDIPAHIRMASALHAASFTKKYDHEEVYNYYIECGRSYKRTMENFSMTSKGSLHYILKGRK